MRSSAIIKIVKKCAPIFLERSRYTTSSALRTGHKFEKIFHSLALFILIVLAPPTSAESLKGVYIDHDNNVHVLTKEGKNRKVTHQRNACELKLAGDGRTAAWLILNTLKVDSDDIPGSQELIIYRDGKSASIKCTPFIRDYWFWRDGSQIVIDCGGRHFAGREILYDTGTLKELGIYDRTKLPIEKRPDWSSGDDN